MNINYTCKACKKPGAVVVNDGIEMFTIQKWLPLLCCNRCADYLESRRKLRESIMRASVTLSRARIVATGQDLLNIEAKIRESLVGHTKRLTTVVADYCHKVNAWEVEVVNMLMDKPGEAFAICRQYANLIKNS